MLTLPVKSSHFKKRGSCGLPEQTPRQAWPRSPGPEWPARGHAAPRAPPPRGPLTSSAPGFRLLPLQRLRTELEHPCRWPPRSRTPSLSGTTQERRPDPPAPACGTCPAAPSFWSSLANTKSIGLTKWGRGCRSLRWGHRRRKQAGARAPGPPPVPPVAPGESRRGSVLQKEGTEQMFSE